MHKILQVFLLLSFFLSTSFAADFRLIQEVVLKKDELKKILVSYDGKEKLLKFRWTLFINGGLVLFRSYDKIVAQNVLYKRNKNRSFRLELKTRGADHYNVPYLLVRFKEFRHDTKEAVLELLLYDALMTINLKDLK